MSDWMHESMDEGMCKSGQFVLRASQTISLEHWHKSDKVRKEIAFYSVHLIIWLAICRYCCFLSSLASELFLVSDYLDPTFLGMYNTTLYSDY